MTFAKRVFLLAGIYGLLVLTPQYFLEAKLGRDYPPPITHPEQYYGFIGVALAWQLLFLLISRDPERYRLAMLPAVVEKFTFGVAVWVLYLQHRVPTVVLGVGSVDLVLGTLFIVAFRRVTRLSVPPRP
jgi:hypothetical protein